MTGRRAAARLGALESQVMDLLWDQGPSNIRGIIDRLPDEPAYTTIATVLGNLQRKELVISQKEGRSTVYHSQGTREDHVASMMNHALGGSRDRAASILHFAESIPDAELDLLRDYLQRRDRESS
ncbi:MAG: BlaI/MecI/CopY family transcriptional regulator [Corynebacterium sp.]|uniref:BlaI/MecI/CopY family transcriptional regulator n=1 Tax=Corynebacterium sp. TaxID=1720 RepID=UPI00264A4805|nr:BlaI/MecI/CopY family transcriptional regulator [Corynebacterium sp.]MDN5723792.1 BlaI/MecI/CopY family transcriptional regulator [Corynebacterium sp.]